MKIQTRASDHRALNRQYLYSVNHVIGVQHICTKSRLPLDKECPQCSSDMLSSFPILSTEAFTFDYSEKRGVELEFRRRDKKKLIS